MLTEKNFYVSSKNALLFCAFRHKAKYTKNTCFFVQFDYSKAWANLYKKFIAFCAYGQYAYLPKQNVIFCETLLLRLYCKKFTNYKQGICANGKEAHCTKTMNIFIFFLSRFSWQITSAEWDNFFAWKGLIKLSLIKLNLIKSYLIRLSLIRLSLIKLYLIKLSLIKLYLIKLNLIKLYLIKLYLIKLNWLTPPNFFTCLISA